ncbi:MAG: NTP transferase domain-containing protein [Methanomicrobiales archaeon]|nr:NTP transferase domain-containing protein [Methanomicrobiales archaeon]
MSLKAVILAAGEGRRLRPLTQNRPKALIPVANKPIIEHNINSLVNAGIRDIIVVVGFRKEQVMRHLSQLSFPVMIVQQAEQLGTAHALLCAKGMIKDDVLVIPGDNYIDSGSLRDIITIKNSLLYTTHKQPSNFGVITIEGDIVTSITEKPIKASRMTVSCGIYHISSELVWRIADNSMSEVIDAEIRLGTKITAIKAHSWQDAIYPWDLLTMNERLLTDITAQKAGIISSSAVIQGPVSIGKGTEIKPGVVITGPVFIGEDCKIGAHAVIEPGTSIGSRVTVNSHTTINKSIIMNDAVIASHCSISGSVIGEGCTIGENSLIVHKDGFIILDNTPIRSSCGVIMGNGVISSPNILLENVIVGNNVCIQGKSDKRFSNSVIPDKTQVM